MYIVLYSQARTYGYVNWSKVGSTLRNWGGAARQVATDAVRSHPILTAQAASIPIGYGWGRMKRSSDLRKIETTSQEKYRPENKLPSGTKVALGTLFPGGGIGYLSGMGKANTKALQSGRFQQVGIRKFPSQKEVRTNLGEIERFNRQVLDLPLSRQQLRKEKLGLQNTSEEDIKMIPRGWKVPEEYEKASALPSITFYRPADTRKWKTFGPRPKDFKE